MAIPEPGPGAAVSPRRFSTRARCAPVTLLLMLVATGGTASGSAAPFPQTTAPPSGPAPHSDFRAQPLEYPGPGREDPAPDDLTEVAIGWFGPRNPTDPLAGGPWVAAALAIEEANASGGYQGLPFRLLPRWSDSPWGNGAALVTKMAYEDRVWAIVGSVDGPTTHLAEQVVAKARLALVSPVATDPSVNLAGVSWMFSCAPGDHLWAPLLADSLLAALRPGQSFAVVATTDHDSRLAAVELSAALAHRNRGPILRVDLLPGVREIEPRLVALATARPAAVLVVAGPEDGARLVAALRRQDAGCLLFGTPQMGRNRFIQLAGPDAEGIRVPLLQHPIGADSTFLTFARRFREIAGEDPDFAAAHAYDAVRLLIAAIRRAGLNRARIRDAIAAASPWPGVTGPIHWDAIGQNARPVTTMAIVRNGRIQPLDASSHP